MNIVRRAAYTGISVKWCRGVKIFLLLFCVCTSASCFVSNVLMIMINLTVMGVGGR